MDYSENPPINNQNEILITPYLTRDQEHEIMVLTLRQVIGGDASFVGEALPPPDAGPCPLCGLTGCSGCAFSRRSEEVKKEEMKYKGVRKKPSGNWSAEIWDPNLREKKWLGTFPTVEMAARAYDEAAAELVGRMSASGRTISREGIKRRRR